MTNLEAVKAEINPYSVDSLTIEKALIDINVSSAGTYAITSKADIAKASVKILTGLLALASEGEGGFSQGFSIEGLKIKIADIAKENSLDPPVSSTNSIRDKSHYW